MKKITKLKICDWSLLAGAIIMLASGIQLEVRWLGTFVWLHIAIGLTFFALIAWHLYLHFNWRNWVKGLKQQPSIVTKWLAVFGALTLLTAIIATIHMLEVWHHSSIGGWHGKIGFIFIALVIGHVIKRIKFYRSR